jgi:hypothetical protein
MFEKRQKIKAFMLLLLIAGIAAQLYALRELKNSTSWITWVDGDEVAAAASDPDPEIGGIRWPAVWYASAGEMEPFRRFFNEHCGGLRGIAAASCVSNQLIERVPFGEPSTELFQPGYSPVVNFHEHLAGKPGHCVSYSAITANVLLSAGIPARMIQTLPKTKYGHTIIEVWDDQHGWAVLDPLSDSLITDGEKPISAIAAHRLGGSVTRVKADLTKPNNGHLNDYFKGDNPFAGTVFVLEPWIHARAGEKQMPVVRGSFLAFGEWDPGYGLYQKLLFAGILISLLAGAVIGVSLLYDLAVRRGGVAK